VVDERIVKRLEARPDEARNIGKAVALEVTGELTGRWVVDCSKNPASVRESDEAAATTITLDAVALESMLRGELSPPAAFMSGQIKVDGDLSAAVKLGQFLM
jgi:putative sterol carrier protein